MRKLFFASAIILFSCISVNAKETENNTSFSILGDSYSTFEGFTDPVNNAQWYPHDGCNVTDVNQCWWKLFEAATGIKLVQNNSFSGSTICTHSWNNVTDLTNSFVGRVDNLKKAGIIIVEGATNDNNAGSEIGDYVWSDFTDAQKRTFRGGTAYIIDYLKTKYPDSVIIFMLNSDLRSDINESVETICKHYEVALLKLENITKVDEHPDAEGMIAIKDQLINLLNDL